MTEPPLDLRTKIASKGRRGHERVDGEFWGGVFGTSPTSSPTHSSFEPSTLQQSTPVKTLATLVGSPSEYLSTSQGTPTRLFLPTKFSGTSAHERQKLVRARRETISSNVKTHADVYDKMCRDTIVPRGRLIKKLCGYTKGHAKVVLRGQRLAKRREELTVQEDGRQRVPSEDEDASSAVMQCDISTVTCSVSSDTDFSDSQLR